MIINLSYVFVHALSIYFLVLRPFERAEGGRRLWDLQHKTRQSANGKDYHRIILSKWHKNIRSLPCCYACLQRYVTARNGVALSMASVAVRKTQTEAVIL